MDNQEQTNYFPTIDKPEVHEWIAEVEIEELGFTAKIKRRSNFSEFFASEDEKFDKLARNYSQIWKVRVTESTVRVADQLAQGWVEPSLEGGRMPNRDDFVKLSVTNGDAFTELVAALNAPENKLDDDVEKAEGDALADFTGGAEDTLGSS